MLDGFPEFSAGILSHGTVTVIIYMQGKAVVGSL